MSTQAWGLTLISQWWFQLVLDTRRFQHCMVPFDAKYAVSHLLTRVCLWNWPNQELKNFCLLCKGLKRDWLATPACFHMDTFKYPRRYFWRKYDIEDRGSLVGLGLLVKRSRWPGNFEFGHSQLVSLDETPPQVLQWGWSSLGSANLALMLCW